MANRYPLIIDTLDANKIKELQTGDNLNLADNSIVGVQNITALGTIDAAVITVNGNRLVAQNFLNLSDTPSTYTGNADKFVAVNTAGTGIEFRPLSAFGNVDVSSLDISGNILPVTNNTSTIGSNTLRFAEVWATDVYANLKSFSGTTIFDATTGLIPYAALQGNPTNVSEFINDSGFATTSEVNSLIGNFFGGGGTLTADITGSVFANDSTMLVDGTSGTLVGNIHYPTIGSITAGTKVQLGTTELTSTIEPPTTNTGAIGTTTKRFGIGYFQNINASGNITAATFNGTLNGVLIGEHVGSVYGDDSTVLVDGVNSTLRGHHIGDHTGSVFADDSGVVIDGITGTVVGPVNSSDLRSTSPNVRLGLNAGLTNQGTYSIAIGERAGNLNQSADGIAIGYAAGRDDQQTDGIAIGQNAGQVNQGASSVAIGTMVGKTNQHANTIMLSATGAEFNSTQANSFFVKPIREAINDSFLRYNTTTGEVTYTSSAAGTFDGDLTGSVYSDNSTLLVDGINARHNFPNNVLADLSDVSNSTPSAGEVLKWDGSQWAPGADATSGGGGTNADTLDGFDSPYFLNWTNFTNTPTTLAGYGITDAIGSLSADTTPSLSGELVTGQNRIAFADTGTVSFLDFTVTQIGQNNNTVLSSVKSINFFLDSNGGDSGQAFRIFNNIDPDSSPTETDRIFKVSENGNVNIGNHLIMDQGSIVFEGTSADDHETTLTPGNPTQDNTITLPDASGTIALLSTVPGQLSAQLGAASGGGGGSYDSATGVITFTPADLATINIVTDATPQLGGTLDANGNTINMGTNVITDTKVGNWDTSYGWGNHASAGYLTGITTQSIYELSNVNTTASPTNNQVLTWDSSNSYWSPADPQGGGSIGAFTFTGSVMDTNDSSSITVTPAMTLSSDLTVQNDLVVSNTVRANKLVSTAAGVPKFESTTNIELNAQGAVIIGSSQLRIKSFTTAERDALTASTGDIIYNTTLSKMQLRIGSNWKSIAITDDIPTNNNQLTNGAGYLTTATDIHTFTMTTNGSDYIFAQDSRYFPLAAENDPVLYVRRGETYHFINNTGGSHPFQIRTSNGGSAYNTGVTNNGAASGTIVWTVPMTAPSSVYYQCTVHSNMGNTINIVT